MTIGKEETSSPQPTSIEVFDKTEESWERIRNTIDSLNKELPGDEYFLDRPVLGAIINGEDHAAYPSWKDAFLSDDTTVVLLRDPQKNKSLVGYTFAMPMDKMDPQRDEESDKKTAYLYTTVLSKEYQGKGQVGPLVDELFKSIVNKGYSFIERDSMVGSGYADAIQRHYAGFIMGQPYDHNPWGIGLERHFRIDAKGYVAHLRQKKA